jgi:hypothetical protein
LGDGEEGKMSGLRGCAVHVGDGTDNLPIDVGNILPYIRRISHRGSHFHPHRSKENFRRIWGYRCGCFFRRIFQILKLIATINRRVNGAGARNTSFAKVAS